MPASLLLDIGPLGAGTDRALETLYKALAEPGNETGIWEPHQSPYIREHIEAVTYRLQFLFLSLQNGLLESLGTRSAPTLAKAEVPWRRWQPADFQAAVAHLNGKPTESYTLDDWMLLVDVLIQRYLPGSVIETEAEYLAVRSRILGQVQARLGDTVSVSVVSRIAQAIPTSLDAAKEVFDLSARDLAALRFAEVHAGELITDITEDARHRMKQALLDYQMQIMTGNPEGTTARLENRLLEEFATLNKELRRVAITETGIATNEGFVSSLAPGTRVRRVEVYRTACPFCRSIHGTVLTVVDPSKPDKNPETEVWSGKNNVGRSASPRKRVGNQLIDREPDELWQIPAGLVHPHCRGSWSVVSGPGPAVNPSFVAWLDRELA